MTGKTIDVIIERDIWVKEGDEVVRYRKGTMTTVPLDEAVLDGIASGAVRRVKPEELVEMKKKAK
jgi:hypothetical protein